METEIVYFASSPLIFSIKGKVLSSSVDEDVDDETEDEDGGGRSSGFQSPYSSSSNGPTASPSPTLSSPPSSHRPKLPSSRKSYPGLAIATANQAPLQPQSASIINSVSALSPPASSPPPLDLPGPSLVSMTPLDTVDDASTGHNEAVTGSIIAQVISVDDSPVTSTSALQNLNTLYGTSHSSLEGLLLDKQWTRISEKRGVSVSVRTTHKSATSVPISGMIKVKRHPVDKSLSDLVILCKAVRFSGSGGFEAMKVNQMCSISEHKASALLNNYSKKAMFSSSVSSSPRDNQSFLSSRPTSPTSSTPHLFGPPPPSIPVAPASYSALPTAELFHHCR